MKKLIALLIALTLMCNLPCFADGFELMGFDFATTIDEAEALLGEDIQKRVESYPELGELTVLQKYGLELFGYDSEAITLIFFNGKMMAVVISYTDDVLSDATALVENISAEYGTATYREDYSFTPGDDSSRKAKIGYYWYEIEGDIEGTLALDSENEDEYFCFVGFTSMAVIDEMEEALLSQYE